MAAYYNEIDPYAAQWLRNLIAAGHIAFGDVDERSIEDVRPDDLRPYTQCHFFAGIGVWSLALRRAGWGDERPVYTGSCPCQPFSAAGQGVGFADERHLWPAFNHLIGERRPAVVFGEQVASKDAGPWLDLVQADLEGLDYAFGAVAFPSAGVGAPHIRERLYWVAYPSGQRRNGLNARLRWREPQQDSSETDWRSQAVRSGRFLSARELAQIPYAGKFVDPRRLADDDDDDERLPLGSLSADGGRVIRIKGPAAGQDEPVRGFWSGADWIACRDGKWRPVEPGAFPLANGAPARVGRLRAYGNAINAEAARHFILATGLV